MRGGLGLVLTTELRQVAKRQSVVFTNERRVHKRTQSDRNRKVHCERIECVIGERRSAGVIFWVAGAAPDSDGKAEHEIAPPARPLSLGGIRPASFY